jgi:hypothetical protein
VVRRLSHKQDHVGPIPTRAIDFARLHGTGRLAKASAFQAEQAGSILASRICARRLVAGHLAASENTWVRFPPGAFRSRTQTAGDAAVYGVKRVRLPSAPLVPSHNWHCTALLMRTVWVRIPGAQLFNLWQSNYSIVSYAESKGRVASSGATEPGVARDASARHGKGRSVGLSIAPSLRRSRESDSAKLGDGAPGSLASNGSALR